jgi:hypothetical protein
VPSTGGDDGRAGRSGLPLRQEQRRGIRDRLQTRPGHLEDAQLRDRAEAVLDRAHDPVVLALLALEVEHGVDDVLERLRARQAAVLGDVADQERGDAAALATNSSCVATSRTWLMLPGAEGKRAE